MAYTINILPITLTGAGTEIPTLNVTDAYDKYFISGTATAIGNYAIVPTGSPQIGTTYRFNYRGTLDITTNRTTFSLFGVTITQAQLLKTWNAECYYNGASWEVELQMDFSQSSMVSSSNIGNSTILNANISDSTIDICSKAVNLSVCTAKINDLAVTTGKINALAVTDAKLAADSVITSKVLDSNITNAKLATMADQTIKGNISGGVANPYDITISTLVNTNAWGLTGNSGTVAGTNFIGTTDASDLLFKVNSVEVGKPFDLSLGNCTYGTYLPNNTTGYSNLGIGSVALSGNTTGFDNVAVGVSAMLGNTIGSSNTSVGRQSLENNLSGIRNTTIGRSAGFTITSGSRNTLLGNQADVNSSTALNRIALGDGASATADYQFAIPANVTHINFALNSHSAGALLTSDGSGIGTWNIPVINTTAGDSATIDAVSGRFRKDTSGATFTLTNSFITASSIVILTMNQLDATATRAVVAAGVGSAVITFDAAPTSNLDVNFLVIN